MNLFLEDLKKYNFGIAIDSTKTTQAAQYIIEALEISRENNYQTFTKDALTQFDKKTYFETLDKILFN